MRIAVDAMGTDERPHPDVEGSIEAAKTTEGTIILVGDEPKIRRLLDRHQAGHLSIEIVHAAETISMTDKPSDVMKSKPQSSLHVGMNLVKQGQADAFVTMGNTGAAHAIATLSTLRRIQGIRRPALTAIFPFNGQPIIFLDIGANADSKPEWLQQYAIMGDVYARRALNITSPRIATLSNGEEEGKGNRLALEARELISTLDLNYIGNVEPKQVLANEADVVVIDGFVGNIFIKTFEATASHFAQIMRKQLARDPVSAIGGTLSRRAFNRVRTELDSGQVGAAPLLGVNGIVLIGHGSSKSYAIANAIRQAQDAVRGEIVHHIATGITEINGH